MTVIELQERVAQAFNDLTAAKHSPEALKKLLQPLGRGGKALEISLRNPKTGNRRHGDGSIDSAWFSNGEFEVVIGFADAPEQNAKRVSTPREDLLLALKEAEESNRFVALKWFRDTFVPQREFQWAKDLEAVQRVLSELTTSNQVLTAKIPNPRAGAFPTTTIALNRLHPDVKPLLEGPASTNEVEYEPVEIAGEPLSRTILRDRR